MVTSSLAVANVSHLMVAPVWVLNWFCDVLLPGGELLRELRVRRDVHVERLAGAVGATTTGAAGATGTAATAGGEPHGDGGRGEHCQGGSHRRRSHSSLPRFGPPWGVAHLTCSDLRRWLPPPVGGGPAVASCCRRSRGNRWQPLVRAARAGQPRAMATLTVHPDRLLPADPETRTVARRLYEAVRDLPIVSPHGHVDPRILVDDEPFADPASLFIQPDHYVTRLLHAGGVGLDRLGVGEGPLPEGRAARGVAAAVRELAPAARHAGAVLVRQRAGRDLRRPGTAERGERRRPVRPDRRAARRAGPPAPRAAAPVRDRRAGDDRRPGRRPRARTPGSPRTPR